MVALSPATVALTATVDTLQRLLEAKERSTQELRLSTLSQIHELKLQESLKFTKASQLQVRLAEQQPDVARVLHPLIARHNALTAAETEDLDGENNTAATSSSSAADAAGWANARARMAGGREGLAPRRAERWWSAPRPRCWY